MSGTILVTDGEQRAALAVTRSLGRAGWRVEVAAAVTPSLAGASRWCRAEHPVPDPLAEPRAFSAAVAARSRKLGARLVIPMTDASTEPLLEAETDLPRVPLGGLEAYRRLSDKVAVSALAAEAGLDIPNQVVLERRSAGTSALRYPVVVKPARSVAADGGTRFKLGVGHAATPDGLRRTLDALPEAAFPVLVQERVIGPGTGVFLLRWEGRRLASFIHRREREKPPAGGVSVLARSVAEDPDLRDRADRLLDLAGWSGPAMVEFKRDAVSGVPYLMEVNARFWGSLQLAIDAGVDFPRLLVDAVLGGPAQPVAAYRIDARIRWFWGDVDHLLARLRHSAERLALPPGAPSRAGAVRDFLLSTLNPGVRNEVFRLGDPGPGLRETINWFRRR